MSGDAVVFSGYFPDEPSLMVLRLFLDLWESFYADCDFFVGINRPSVDRAIRMLEDSPLRIRHAIVEPQLVTDSDVSGYQAALALMKRAEKSHRVVWFMHSKGASHFARGPANPSFGYLLRVALRFLADRRAVTDEMIADPKCGTYSFEIAKDKPGASATSNNPRDVLGQFLRFDRPDFHRYFCVATLYAMNGRVVDEFLRDCDERFFTSNLISECGADRYFFEQTFPNIAWRKGYRPRFRHWYGKADFLEPVDSFEADWAAYER
jgi:hypothetical protein